MDLDLKTPVSSNDINLIWRIEEKKVTKNVFNYCSIFRCFFLVDAACLAAFRTIANETVKWNHDRSR